MLRQPTSLTYPLLGWAQASAAAELGTPAYARTDAPATPAQKQLLKRLSAAQVPLTELAGEPVQRVLTHAPGNGAPIDGVKVEAASAWFAARPSGTEDVYKIYAESFRGADHLRLVLDHAQTVVDEALRGVADKERRV